MLTDEPVQAAPDDGDREDRERHTDEEPSPKALVGRVARVRSDRERAIDKRSGHDDEGRRSPRMGQPSLACAVRPARAESLGDLPSSRFARRRHRTRGHRARRVRRRRRNKRRRAMGRKCLQRAEHVDHERRDGGHIADRQPALARQGGRPVGHHRREGGHRQARRRPRSPRASRDGGGQPGEERARLARDAAPAAARRGRAGDGRGLGLDRDRDKPRSQRRPPP